MDEYGFYIESVVVENDVCIHTHEFYEVFIICAGSMDHVIGDKTYMLKKGGVFCHEA